MSRRHTALSLPPVWFITCVHKAALQAHSWYTVTTEHVATGVQIIPSIMTCGGQSLLNTLIWDPGSSPYVVTQLQDQPGSSSSEDLNYLGGEVTGRPELTEVPARHSHLGPRDARDLWLV